VSDVLLNKKATIERCVARVREWHGSEAVRDDQMRQDAIAMNLQRACESAIDMANHLIRARKLGLPQESRDAFDLLKQGGIIDEEMNSVLESMVGFRNILVHEYRALDPAIVEAIIRDRLDDLLAFANIAVKAAT
jgi:uncharacterized protein YutE (UPF0331/DUF86 family)